MLEGTLEYFLTDELTDEKTVLFSTNKAGVLIGWEVLHAPQRFITNVAVASGNANIKKITIKEFLSVLTPQSLQSICRQINSFLEISFLKQSKLLSQRVEQGAIDHDKYFIANDSDLTERIR